MDLGTLFRDKPTAPSDGENLHIANKIYTQGMTALD